MKSRVTRETIYGQVIYPDVLPRRRGNNAGKCQWMMSGVILTVCVAVAGEHIYKSSMCLVVVLIGYVSLRIVAEFLKRCSYYTEERLHLASRYKSNQFYLLERLFQLPSTLQYICVICIVSVALILHVIFNITDILCHYPLFIPGCIILGEFIMEALQLEKSTVHDSMMLENLQPLDCGSGMASNFFYGYLRLCLPNTGDSEKGMRERIDDYIATQQLTDDSFPVKRLFILIPSSTYVPNDLNEISYGWMEKAGSLEKQVKDRAGVIGRVYKNSVYRIRDPDSDNPAVYVVAEGATPIKTFYEALQDSGDKQALFREHQMEIILMFYEKLREVLREHKECKPHCELVYYVDTDEHGLNNVNVARIILNRIDEIKEEEAYLNRIRNSDD